MNVQLAHFLEAHKERFVEQVLRKVDQHHASPLKNSHEYLREFIAGLQVLFEDIMYGMGIENWDSEKQQETLLQKWFGKGPYPKEIFTIPLFLLQEMRKEILKDYMEQGEGPRFQDLKQVMQEFENAARPFAFSLVDLYKEQFQK
ncbi:MAG: hypothetical protein AAF694_18370 [Bacteroidota bacterium]